MSRILRRPMFRGGRVDSRGTGITSGLSYAKGGRVDPRQKYFFGGHVDQDKLNKIMGKSGTLIGDTNRSLTGINDLLYNWIARPAGNLPYWLSDYILGTDFGMPIQKKDSFKEWVGMAPEEPIITDSGAIPKAIKQQENAIKLEELEKQKELENNKSLEEIMKEMMGPQKTAKEKVAEYKKIFEDAYGSGRGADATAMLLNFAGKALKPEATTKSAFGEFFEEEGKRPSESKKYKDAATTAAINAYLTGEKDYDSMMKQMKLIDYQIDAKTKGATDLKKTWNLNDYVMNRGTGVSKTEGLENGIRDKIKLNPEYTDYKKIKSKENVPELIAEEYVGVIFMDEGTREVFAVVMGEDGPAKQVLY